MPKELFEKKLLGIHYDAKGNVKAIDVQGMSLKEVFEELKLKLEIKEEN